MFCGGGQIENRLAIITLRFFAVQIQFSELIFRKVIAVLGGNFKVTDCPKDIFDRVLGQQYFSSKVGGIGVVLCDHSFKIADSPFQILRNDFSAVQQLAENILRRSEVLVCRFGQQSDRFGYIL